MNKNNKELLELIIAEKDKIKLKYHQKLNSIMQHYGVNFDVEYYKDENIKSVKFMNLKGKKGYSNLSVIYDGKTRKIDYIDYTYSDSRTIKNYDHKKFAFDLENEFKLKMMMAEIERANSEYLKEINEIDLAYKNTTDNFKGNDKVLQINKNKEN